MVGAWVGSTLGDKVGSRTGALVGCGSVGEVDGAGLVVGRGVVGDKVGLRVPSMGIGVGSCEGVLVFGTITFLQSAWAKHSSPSGHSEWWLVTHL